MPTPKGPRRAASDIKIRFVSFRVTPEELFLLTAAAAAIGQKPSSFARDRTLAAIERPHERVRGIVQVPAGNMALYGELRRQGVNLNQIAHHCHSLKVPPPAALEPLLAELSALMRLLVPDKAA